MSTEGQSPEDKHLPASEQRLKKAREEGQVARSRDLSSFLLLGGAALAMSFMAPRMWEQSLQLVASGLALEPGMARNPQFLGEQLTRLTWQGFVVAGPMLGLLTVAGVAAALALGGWNFTFQPLMPQFSRIDPIAGFSRIVSRQGLAEMAKLLCLIAILAVVVGTVVWGERESAAGLAGLPVQTAVSEVGRISFAGLSMFVVVIAFAALGDVPLQIWRHTSQLRMSHDEAKREQKENDGDPHVKAKIRAAQRSMAQRRMMERVPKADVIVTNPTHYAVALQYSDNATGAPRVVAKGLDLVAQRIREIGEAHKVPVLEAPPLARALYRHTELDQEVPVALYQAVAQVLAYVFQLRRYQEFGGPASVAPVLPDHIAVPPGMDPHEVNA
jgi:flagellar biosynthetic protein FlhB